VTAADKNINELFGQIDEIENIQMVSNFNPTKIDLTRPFHTSNWVAFMFWLLVLLALALIWSIVRHFGWYLRWVSPLSKIVWTCCSKIFRKSRECLTRKRNTAKREQRNLEQVVWDSLSSAEQDQEETGFLSEGKIEQSIPVLDASPPFESTDLPNGCWRAVKAAYGNWQLKMILAEGEKPPLALYYNTKTKKITNAEGTVIPNIEPPRKDDLESFYSAVRSSESPPHCIASNGAIRHKIFTFLRYSPENGSWMNEITYSPIPGFMPPLGFRLLPPLLPGPNAV
jgi:hypothetical protein